MPERMSQTASATEHAEDPVHNEDDRNDNDQGSDYPFEYGVKNCVWSGFDEVENQTRHNENGDDVQERKQHRSPQAD
jgi:hypothetical protein